MPCYHPLTLYPALSGPSKETGKIPLRGIKQGGDPKQPTIVPCGRCTGCRLESSRQWAIRCVNEAQMHEKNCFITLTYSDENLTLGDTNTTLYPRDLQLFLKRLRKKYGKGIRFFACGEYGDASGRPHYHACIFGWEPPDKMLYTIRKETKLYQSETLKKLWGLGFVTVGDLTFESAAYVARYVMKKKTGKQSGFYNRAKILPEFTRMSRRPGVGKLWFDKYKTDVFPHDYQIIRGGLKCRPPKYYGSLYEHIYPQKMNEIKELRKKNALKNSAQNTKYHLNAKEVINSQKIKLLKRTMY